MISLIVEFVTGLFIVLRSLLKPRILIVTGKYYSGKTSFATLLRDTFRSQGYTCYIYNFAKHLKLVIGGVLNMDTFDDDCKNVKVTLTDYEIEDGTNRLWNMIVENLDDKNLDEQYSKGIIRGWFAGNQISVGTIMQRVGMGMRDLAGENFWKNLTFEEIRTDASWEDPFHIAIIADGRCENELVGAVGEERPTWAVLFWDRVFMSIFGMTSRNLTIRTIGDPSGKAAMSTRDPNSPSETGLDYYPRFDWVVDNTIPNISLGRMRNSMMTFLSIYFPRAFYGVTH